EDFGGMADQGKSEGNTPGVEFLHPVGDYPSGVFIQSSGARKKGSSVTIGTHAEHDEVEAGPLACRKLEEFLQFVFVLLGGGLGIQFGVYAVNVFSRNIDPGKQ